MLDERKASSKQPSHACLLPLVQNLVDARFREYQKVSGEFLLMTRQVLEQVMHSLLLLDPCKAVLVHRGQQPRRILPRMMLAGAGSLQAGMDFITL